MYLKAGILSEISYEIFDSDYIASIKVFGRVRVYSNYSGVVHWLRESGAMEVKMKLAYLSLALI